MALSFFNPDSDRVPTDADLFALPFNWMTAACMDYGFRRLTGWQGLAPATSVARAFTCRIKSHPGVFGLLPLSAYPGNPGNAVFHIFYFPATDDPLLDCVSLPAAIAASSPDAASMIRDFPAYPDFCGLFILAELRLSLTHPERALGLALTAPTQSRIVVPHGIKTPDGGWLVEPDGLEEDLPALSLARDLFCVLAAGVAAALGKAPDSYSAAETAAMQRVRKESGDLESHSALDAVLRTEALTWGEAASAAWPPMNAAADPALYRLVRFAAGTEAPDSAAAASLKKPQLIVLSGFLGSGKTTFLNQFIEFHLSRDQLVAVIQNEIGETGVDANLLEGDDSVLELDAGCVCCSLTGSLTRGLRQLNANLSPEFIVLETTGLANPMNMIDEFHEIGDLAHLSAVISVVDASRFHENLAASEVAEQQIRAADTVILNKCDLVSDDDRLVIEGDIHKINPQARIIAATNGRVNPAILGAGLSRHVTDDSNAAKLTCDYADHSHTHGVTHLDEGFSALRFTLAYSISREMLMRTLAACPANVFRVKGVARLDDTYEPQVIQYVPGHADCEPAARHVTDAPFILIIGRDLDARTMKALWLPLLDKDTNA